MIHKGVARTFFLYAYSIASGAPKTGDAANITVYKAEDAGVATQITDTITEIDSTNMPGWYRLTTTLNGDSVAIAARSSTSGVAVTLGGVYLNTGAIPSANAGSTNGLPVIGAAPLTNLDVKVSTRSTLSASDVWSHASRTLSGFGFQVTVGGYATGRSPSEQLQSLGYSSARAAKLDNLDAAVSSRLAASSYIAPDNASIAAIKTQTDKLQFDSNNYVYAVGVGGGGGTDWTDDEKKQIRYRLGIDGTTASPQSNTPHLGSTYSTLDDLAAHVSTRLAASAYTAPDNDGISAIKEKTDRLRFDANSNVYATGLGGGGGSVQVIVQPLPVYPIDFAPDGGVVEAFTFARIRKSWLVTKTNLEGHDLRFIVFSQANPLEALAECSGDEIAITLQGEDSLVALDAAEREIQPGLYGWVLRDQTADTVLLRGKFLMKPAPDAG